MDHLSRFAENSIPITLEMQMCTISIFSLYHLPNHGAHVMTQRITDILNATEPVICWENISNVDVWTSICKVFTEMSLSRNLQILMLNQVQLLYPLLLAPAIKLKTVLPLALLLVTSISIGTTYWKKLVDHIDF